jgi:hypothetical protein
MLAEATVMFQMASDVTAEPTREVDVRVRAHITERHAARRGFEGDFERVTTDPLEKMKAVVKQEGLARGNAEGRIIVQSKPFG